MAVVTVGPFLVGYDIHRQFSPSIHSKHYVSQWQELGTVQNDQGDEKWWDFVLFFIAEKSNNRPVSSQARPFNVL